MSVPTTQLSTARNAKAIQPGLRTSAALMDPLTDGHPSSSKGHSTITTRETKLARAKADLNEAEERLRMFGIELEEQKALANSEARLEKLEARQATLQGRIDDIGASLKAAKDERRALATPDSKKKRDAVILKNGVLFENAALRREAITTMQTAITDLQRELKQVIDEIPSAKETVAEFNSRREEVEGLILYMEEQIAKTTKLIEEPDKGLRSLLKHRERRLKEAQQSAGAQG